MKPILQFSGGKDSTALLYLFRERLSEIDVVFAETGGTFPHVVRHIEETCEKLKANLIVIRPPLDVMAYTAIKGLPSDIVPVEASAEMAPYLRDTPKQLLQSYLTCCGAMLWQPMMTYIHDNKIELVFRGSKASDSRVGVGPKHIENGVTYESPLWEWSDEDVFAFLSENGVSLPAHYAHINDSIDCWMCTAHLAHHGDEKMRYIRDHYPDLWPTVQDRMGKMRNTVLDEMMKVTPAVKEAA
jgi:3'-phosphoadenosine 5'-phosphosulfate sulfotransferase (PAPS reductase)/FAD synthetase